MNIIAPLKKSDDVPRLAETGAREFFGGVYDLEWESTYGPAIEYNRRGCYGKKANFESWKELERALLACKERGLKFSLTMNAISFRQCQMPYLKGIMERYMNIGGTDIIISDPTIIDIARDYGMSITVSSCANCFSVETAKYYYECGCKSIIFPRDMSMGEMEEIKAACPQLSFEAFLMYSGCRYNDGNCRSLHNTEYRELCNFCDTGDWKYQRMDGKAMTDDDLSYVEKCGSIYARYLKNACGQCALYRLLHIADRVKILERVGSVEKLIETIDLTKRNIATATMCRSEEEYLLKMERPENVVCLMDCYYPEYVH